MKQILIIVKGFGINLLVNIPIKICHALIASNFAKFKRNGILLIALSSINLNYFIMIGFEIEHKNEKMTAALNVGVVSIIFTRVNNMDRDEVQLSVSGLNIEKQENYKWLFRNLLLGEEFKIKVIEFEDSSNPLKVEHYPMEKLILDDKLKRYQNLKKELEEAGLI